MGSATHESATFRNVTRSPIKAIADAGILGVTSYLGAVERHARLYGREAGSVQGERLQAVAAIFDLTPNLTSG